jgi:hypothetical protein
MNFSGLVATAWPFDGEPSRQAGAATEHPAEGDGSGAARPPQAMLAPGADGFIECTIRFLRACFATQPKPADFQTMLAFNMLAPHYVRAGLSGRPANYTKAPRLPVLVTHGEKDRILATPIARFRPLPAEDLRKPQPARQAGGAATLSGRRGRGSAGRAAASGRKRSGGFRRLIW